METARVYAGVIFPANQEKLVSREDAECFLLERGDDTCDLVIPEDYYFVPVDDGRFILYLPAVNASFLVNEGTKKLFDDIVKKKSLSLERDALAALNYFILNGIIIHEAQDCGSSNDLNNLDEYIEEYIKNYAPTHLAICPTSDCNLRCKYCYASGGDKPKYMDLHIAERAIDYVINNAVKIGSDRIILSFHGGGEPMLAFDLIEKSVKYGKERTGEMGLRLELVLTTNLMVEKERLDFIIDNFDLVAVSFDGSKDIQDYNRPAVNGKGSYDLVMRNLKILDKSKVKYVISSTFLKKDISRMEEVLSFLIDNFSNAQGYHFEPFAKISRAEENDLEEIDWKEFAEHFEKAERLAKKYKKTVFKNCWGIKKTGTRFCGGVLDGFWVSLNGNVYSCVELNFDNDPVGHAFKIGKFDSVTGEFVMDIQTLKRLLRRDVNNILNCRGCFAKYNCRGGCPSRVMRCTGDYMDTSTWHECDVVKESVKSALVELLTRAEYRINVEDYLPLAEPDKLSDSDITSD